VIDFSDLPVIDDHVHPWRASTRHASVEELAGQVAFSETVVTSVRREFLPVAQLAPALSVLRRTNLGAQYLLRELARFLDVREEWDAVVSARNVLAEADYRAWTARLFADAGIETLLVDEGGAIPSITLDQLVDVVPVRLRRVARSDNFVRDLLADEDSWPRFFQRYQDALEGAIREGAVAFKSVIAYRSGLDIQAVSEGDARRNFEAARGESESAQKAFRDFLVCHTLDIARERGLWVHFHTGVGDPDIVYQHANPARLYPLLHSERFRRNQVVLVHAGWPWVGEAAAMAAVLPNVYLDVSEGALFGMPNLRQRILEALEACPYSKILYGSDGSLPEGVWIAAKRCKAVLARVVENLVAEGFCSQREAHRVARAILSENAAHLYGL
jgi:uncharacterized protein